MKDFQQFVAEAQAENVTLYYQNAAENSDKVYQAWLEPSGDGWVVRFAFGRRGSTLKPGQKTASPISYAGAKKVYDELVREKMGKGYRPGADTGAGASSAGSTAPYTAPQAGETRKTTKILPMLLNPVESDNDVLRIMQDDSWVAQEKFDGKRGMLNKQGNVVTGYNRKGLEIGIPTPVSTAAGKIKGDFTLDGEFVGDVFHVFDVVEADGKSLESATLKERLKHLEKMVPTSGAVQRVKTVEGLQDKFSMLDDLKRNKREGMVFKKITGTYRSGRAASLSASQAIKYKFWETASVIVKGQHGEKSSFEIQLYDNGKLIKVGTVTVAANQKMPPPGSVVEVRYLYAYKGGSLVQATFLGLRDDIDPEECTTKQLKYKVQEETE